MKKLLFIILTLFSLQSFAQDTTYVKVRGIPGAYNFSKSGDSLIFYVAGERHALSVGSTVDLSNYYNKSEVDNSLNGKLAISDTAAMLSPYATELGKKRDTSYYQSITAIKPLHWNVITPDSATIGLYVDTTSDLSDGSDTTVTTSKSVKNYVDNQISTVTSEGVTRPELIDTANNKVNISDTAAMLSPYLRKIDTTGKWISPAVANATYATITNLNLKANDNTVLKLVGGTISGDILPNAGNTINLGTSGAGFKNVQTYRLTSNSSLTFSANSFSFNNKISAPSINISGDATISGNVISPTLYLKSQVDSTISSILQYTYPHEISVPDSFNFKPFDVLRWDGRTVIYDIDLNDEIQPMLSTFTTYYCDPTSGSESNDGLSLAAPKKSLYNLINLSGKKVIYILPGNHDRADHGLFNITKTTLDSTVIIGLGNCILNNYYSTSSYSFSSYSGTTYSATSPMFGNGTKDSVGTVVDYAVMDTFNLPIRYRRASSLTGCTDSAGTFYVTVGGTLYINVIDGRTFDNNIRISNGSIFNFYFRANAGYVYIENINFQGGGLEFSDNSHSTANSFSARVKNCISTYAILHPSITSNPYGFQGSSIRSMYFQNCKTYSDEGDGFHYSNDVNTANTFYTNVLELNCTAFNCGNIDKSFTPSPADACNGSSTHGKTNIYRINGNYFYNRGQQVSDIGYNQNMIIGCNAWNSTAPSNTGEGRSADFGVNQGQVYLINCTSNKGVSRSTYSAYSKSLGGSFTDGQLILSRNILNIIVGPTTYPFTLTGISNDSTFSLKSFSPGYTSTTVNYTVTNKDYTVNAKGTLTITLPDATTLPQGTIYNIVSSQSGTVTINTSASQTFDNITGTPTTLSMTTLGTYTIQNAGGSWLVISKL